MKNLKGLTVKENLKLHMLLTYIGKLYNVEENFIFSIAFIKPSGSYEIMLN